MEKMEKQDEGSQTESLCGVAENVKKTKVPNEITIENDKVIISYHYPKKITKYKVNILRITRRIYDMLNVQQIYDLKKNLNLDDDVDLWKYIEENRIYPKLIKKYIDPVDYKLKYDREKNEWFLIYRYVYRFENPEEPEGEKVLKCTRCVKIKELSKRLKDSLPDNIVNYINESFDENWIFD